MGEGQNALVWRTCTFAELDARSLHDILRLRVDVFVVEQDCPYPELDGLDFDALHVTGHGPDGALVAYSRILPPDAEDFPHVGRVVVERTQRGKGIGERLMRETMEVLRRQYGDMRSMVAAQAHLQRFYQRFGYVRRGGEYLLDGIPHVDMIRGDH